MTQAPQIPILIPLAVGAVAVVCTVFTHAVVSMAAINFVRREKRLGRAGVRFMTDVSIVALAVFFLLVAHLIEISLWAILFLICGEFQRFGVAYYHSGVNYTTLGYGDIVMSPSWRLLGPLEAANGMLMFGVSTGMIFALSQRLIYSRFADLRE